MAFPLDLGSQILNLKREIRSLGYTTPKGYSGVEKAGGCFSLTY